MHNSPILTEHRGGHDVKLLDKGEDRSDEHIKSENAPLRIHPTQCSAKTPSAITRLLRGGSKNIFDLDSPTKKDTQVFMRVSEFDERPAGVLQTQNSRGKTSGTMILGAQNNSFVPIDT
jgi:hypothetical protein